MLDIITELHPIQFEAIDFVFAIHGPKYYRRHQGMPGFLEAFFENPAATPFECDTLISEYDLRVRQLRRMIGIIEKFFELQPRLQQWVLTPGCWEDVESDTFHLSPQGIPIEENVSLQQTKDLE